MRKVGREGQRERECKQITVDWDVINRRAASLPRTQRVTLHVNNALTKQPATEYSVHHTDAAAGLYLPRAYLDYV